MLKAYAQPFAELCGWLAELEAEAAADPSLPIGEGTDASRFGDMSEGALRFVEFHARELGLSEVERQVRYIRSERDDHDGRGETFTAERMKILLRSLRQTIWSHLGSRKLFYVRRPEFYEAENLFGAEVAARFERAKGDIAEAGKCLALEHGTAAVFHCMRVAEIGLQGLAHHLGVVLKNHRPLELEDWKTILDAINDKIERLRSPKTMENQKEIQIYSEIAAQFRYFKDAWRNHVSHAREVYEPVQAEIILGHVREFMQDLAGWI